MKGKLKLRVLLRDPEDAPKLFELQNQIQQALNDGDKERVGPLFTELFALVPEDLRYIVQEYPLGVRDELEVKAIEAPSKCESLCWLAKVTSDSGEFFELISEWDEHKPGALVLEGENEETGERSIHIFQRFGGGAPPMESPAAPPGETFTLDMGDVKVVIEKLALKTDGDKAIMPSGTIMHPEGRTTFMSIWIRQPDGSMYCDFLATNEDKITEKTKNMFLAAMKEYTRIAWEERWGGE